MANVIIFNDRAPRTFISDDLEINPSYYNYPSGSYKIASELRKLGLEVLVVNNCFSFTFAGIQQIIENNQKDLLWVGIGTSLMMFRSNAFEYYRENWHNNEDLTMSLHCFTGTGGTKDGMSFATKEASTDLPWGDLEVNRIADFCTKFNAPLLIGGSWVTYMQRGNFGNLHSNINLVKGYAENYVKEFSMSKFRDRTSQPPFIVSNTQYDAEDFKNSDILWAKSDFIHPNNWLPLEVARGCAFNCAYCNFDHRNIRDNYKDPDSLRDEIIRNYEEHGVQNYMLMDDLYNDGKKKVRELYDKVWSRLPFKVEWASYMRLDMFWADPESIEIIKESGARIGNFGIETLHNKAGAKVGKGLGKERILETLTALKESWGTEVLVQGNFIAGLPFEPREHIEETIEWSLSTDLLFSANWQPLWVTPPDHFEIVTDVALNKISKDPDKWEVKWVEPMNWMNSAGLTFREVDQMCINARNKMPWNSLKTRGTFGWSDYADFRAAGLTHEEIVSGSRGNITKERVQEAVSFMDQKIKERISNWLDIKL
jgi:hypothetical protein